VAFAQSHLAAMDCIHSQIGSIKLLQGYWNCARESLLHNEFFLGVASALKHLTVKVRWKLVFITVRTVSRIVSPIELQAGFYSTLQQYQKHVM
jgi:hypothetical protein